MDGVADLHHPREVRRPVVAGATDGHPPLHVPDDTGDPSLAADIVLDLRAAPAPQSPPVRTGEVRRQRDGGRSVRSRELAVGQSLQRGGAQLHYLDALPRIPDRRVG